MEVQTIQITTDLLHKPSFVIHFSSLLQPNRLWKWGALILAIFAACRSLIRRSKLQFGRFSTFYKASTHTIDKISEFDGVDDVSDASSSSDDEQEAGENTWFGGQRYCHEDFHVRGSYKTQLEGLDLRQRRRSTATAAGCTEFNPSKNVVKLWDSFRLRLDLDEDLFNFGSKSVVSTWDSNHDPEVNEFWESPVNSSGAMVFTAEVNGDGGGLIFSGYDSRIGSHSLAMYAEWSSQAEELTDKSSREAGLVYVRDSMNEMITVGDVRMVGRR